MIAVSNSFQPKKQIERKKREKHNTENNRLSSMVNNSAGEQRKNKSKDKLQIT